MTVTPPRQKGRPARPADDVLRAIQQATLDHLFEAGFDGLTMESVAVRAGMAKKTLYQFAPNRDELLALAVRAWTDDIFETWRDATSAGDVADALREALGQLASRVLSPRAVRLFQLLNGEFPAKAEVLAAYRRNGIDRGRELLGHWLQRQVDLGHVPAMDTALAARMALAMALAEPLRTAAIGEPLDAKALARHLDAAAQVMGGSLGA